MPAHGRSDGLEDEEAYGEELVEHVIRLMDRLRIEKAHIAGYSSRHGFWSDLNLPHRFYYR